MVRLYVIDGTPSQRFFGAVGTAPGGTEGRSTPSVTTRFRLRFLWLCCALNQLFIRLIRATLGKAERHTAPSMMTGLRLRLLQHRGVQPPQHPYPKAHTPDSKTAPRTTHNKISGGGARDQRRGIGVGDVVGATFRIAEGCAASAAVTGLDFWVRDGGGVGGEVGVREGGGEGVEGGEEEGYKDEDDVS